MAKKVGCFMDSRRKYLKRRFVLYCGQINLVVKFGPKELTFLFFFCQQNDLRKSEFSWIANVLSSSVTDHYFHAACYIYLFYQLCCN